MTMIRNLGAILISLVFTVAIIVLGALSVFIGLRIAFFVFRVAFAVAAAVFVLDVIRRVYSRVRDVMLFSKSAVTR